MFLSKYASDIIPPVPFITSSYECTHKQNIAKGEKTKSQRKDCTDKQQIQRHKERIIHINKRKIGDRQNGCSKNVMLIETGLTILWYQ